MGDYYLVKVAKGPEWDHARPRREQAGWDEHAAFMDALADEGFIVLGGPVREADGEDVLHVVDAGSQEEVRARLAEDPWAGRIVSVASVEPWLVWLRSPAQRGRNSP